MNVGNYGLGYVSIGPYQQSYPNQQQGFSQSEFAQIFQRAQCAQEQQRMNLSGTKPVVVCAGEVKEAKDLDEAQSIAESLAHQKSADAYILKPVRKVAPKRDVVTTEIA